MGTLHIYGASTFHELLEHAGEGFLYVYSCMDIFHIWTDFSLPCCQHGDLDSIKSNFCCQRKRKISAVLWDYFASCRLAFTTWHDCKCPRMAYRYVEKIKFMKESGTFPSFLGPFFEEQKSCLIMTTATSALRWFIRRGVTRFSGRAVVRNMGPRLLFNFLLLLQEISCHSWYSHSCWAHLSRLSQFQFIFTLNRNAPQSGGVLVAAAAVECRRDRKLWNSAVGYNSYKKENGFALETREAEAKESRWQACPLS